MGHMFFWVYTDFSMENRAVFQPPSGGRATGLRRAIRRAHSRTGALAIKSKLAVLLICTLFALSALSVTSFAKEEAVQAPSLFFPAPKYEFEEVLEGDEVLHDFAIRNRGTAPLNLIRVRPG
jgi:hypothetical protein